MIHLKTNYNIGEVPHSQYPRPQFIRDSFLCLNGKWGFAVGKAGTLPNEYTEEILVPFSPECINSGIGKQVLVEKDDVLCYKKSFELTSDWLNGIALLHFGAVDYYCEVFCNNKKVGSHKGGFTAFTFDVSKYLVEGINEISLIVKDDTENSGAGRGKQSKTPGGIWYTPQSGIWQTVWMEKIPVNHIEAIDYYPNFEQNEVLVKIKASSSVSYQVFDEGNLIVSGESNGDFLLKYDFKPWSPENPKLYDIKVTCGEDVIKSYFAMRSFGIVEDKFGKKRLSLNGKPYFFSGLLDQGYWSDGLLTYPSDEAIYEELVLLKKMGFNTLRKHIKIEPLRWYYYCDKLGFVVWQDFVNGGGEYKFNHIATFPFLGFKHRDDDYAYFARENEKGRKAFVKEWQETVEQLKNCVCISMWTIFNEGWGQFDSAKMQEAVKLVDQSRVIESISGWHDYKNQCDIKSLHTYYTKLKVPKDLRPVTLSEFGGYSLKISGHVFDEKKFFGYKKFKSQEKFVVALKKLYKEKLLPLISKGLSAAIYTQVSDVEEEINGLVTYDRKVIKIAPEEMKALNEALYAEANKVID